jgi:hypothetical protein
MPLTSNSTALIVPPPQTGTTNDIRAIKPPVEIPNSWAWVWWLTASVALIAAGLLAWRWAQKKFFKPAPAIVVPPHVRARNKLREALSLIHDPRLFCGAVSDALRVYLEERFSFRAPERTTEEFLVDLQRTPLLSNEQKESLTAFLQECDLVKFARLEPTEEELRRLHDAALRLVDETQYDRIQIAQEPVAMAESKPEPEMAARP